MTPKQKAEYLVNKLFERSLAYHDACIASKFYVEEIIKILPKVEYMEDLNKSIKNRELQYWEQVKQEIELL